jgi:hypothetical protein
MLLSEFGYTILGGELSSSNGLCETVGGIVEGPVKHFYQKRKLLQHSAVKIVGESRRVRHGVTIFIPRQHGTLLVGW